MPERIRPRARPVEILDPQQKFAARIARPLVADRRAIRMAEVQPPGRRRGKAGDHQPS